MAGGEFLRFNNSVFLSEQDTADRNYSLAYYMKEKNIFPKGFRVQECMDLYFKVCFLLASRSRQYNLQRIKNGAC